MPLAVLENRNEEFRRTQWSNWFLNPVGGLFSIIAASGDLVGFCYCLPNTDPASSADGEMRAGYVLPDYRGGAVGPLIMAMLSQWMLDQGLKSSVLWAFRDNPHRRWYGHLGWSPIIYRDRELCGCSIPEVGYYMADLTKLRDLSCRLIDQSTKRSSSRRERRQDPSSC